MFLLIFNKTKMKRLIPIFFISFLIIAASTSVVFATSGACSSHEGVNCAAGQDSDGSVICIDGTRDSSVMYRDMRNECAEDFVPFSDLDNEHENYESIINLYENNVISGYPDQTFQADNKVNRAEFLKILIEGNGIELDAAQYHSCFPDVTDDWYAKYVCYAKEMNWIQGYPDGDFKPENQIAFVEALKMLIEIHDYAQELSPPEDSDLWYTPYEELAVENGFVDETSAPYDPLEYQSRAQISEMTYRSIVFKEVVAIVDPEPEPIEFVAPVPKIYLGSLDAPVTIYEFSDFQCPFCKVLYENTFDQIKDNYIDSGDVLYVAMDFPLSSHENARDAAHAARCAEDQNKYWEMRDSLYMNQDDWDSAMDPTPTFSRYANNVHARESTFDRCMRSDDHMDSIDEDFAIGQSLGVQGTPTLFINGEMLVGSQSYEDISTIIDGMLET